jgi:hypothetical protein
MKTTTEFLAKNADKLSDGDREAILDAAQQQMKVNHGDVVELASALKNVDPTTAYEHMTAESMKMFGMSVEQLKGVNRAAAEQLGFTEEFQDTLGKFRVSLDLSRAEIAQRIQDQMATEADLVLLQKLGIQEGTAAEKAQALRDKDSLEIYNKQSRSAQDAIKHGKQQTDYAAETAKHQTSLLSQLTTLVDFMTNQFYNAIMGMWDTLLDFPGLGTARKSQRDFARSAADTKNTAVIKALGESQGDKGAFHGKLLQSDAMQKVLAGAKSDPKLIKQVFSDPKLFGEANLGGEALDKAIKDALGSDAFTALSDRIAESHKGKGPGKSETGLKGYGTTSGGVQATGIRAEELQSTLSEADMQKVFEKLGWHMSPELLAKSFPEWEKIMVKEEDKKPAEAAPNKPAATKPQAAPTRGGVVTKPPEVKAQEQTAKQMEAVQETQSGTTQAIDSVHDVLKLKGIRINQSHLDNDIGKTFQDATLAAMEEALFEFALLTSPQAAKNALTLSQVLGGSTSGKGIFGTIKEQAYTAAGVGGQATGKPVAKPSITALPTTQTTAAAAQAVDVKVVLEMKGDLSKYIAQIADQQIIRRQAAAAKK